MAFLNKTVCQDDLVANIEKIQNTGNVVALFCPYLENPVIKGFGVRLPKGIPFFFQQFEQAEKFRPHLDILRKNKFLGRICTILLFKIFDFKPLHDNTSLVYDLSYIYYIR